MNLKSISSGSQCAFRRTEWRAEILDAAKALRRSTAAPHKSPWRVLWCQWMARVSPAWGALAAVWLAIIGVNAFLLGADESPSGIPSTPSFGMMTFHNLHRMQEKLLSDQWEEAAATPPAPPVTKPLSPRSDARRKWESNEARSGTSEAVNRLKRLYQPSSNYETSSISARLGGQQGNVAGC